VSPALVGWGHPGANTVGVERFEALKLPVLVARRMGTSVEMIDKTYGHLAHDTGDGLHVGPPGYDRAA
jgi:hypothetical protein